MSLDSKQVTRIEYAVSKAQFVNLGGLLAVLFRTTDAARIEARGAIGFAARTLSSSQSTEASRHEASFHRNLLRLHGTKPQFIAIY